ncbi:MAG: hypothetical protein AB1486_10415 [Planctomycetota bacterium]
MGRTGFSGVPLTAGRGATTQKDLTIKWNYPVYAPTTPSPATGSRTGELGGALELREVYRILANGDTRPLLVLREFATFDDPGNEKLSRRLYTERTVLLCHWFNCVRLPPHVTELDHPFHMLFAGDDAPQLLLARADGSAVFPFEYKAPGADLEKLMTRVLDDHYAKNPSQVLGQLLKMLPRFDQLDSQIQELKDALDKAIEEQGATSGKAKKLARDLARLQVEKRELEERKEALRQIPLKTATG